MKSNLVVLFVALVVTTTACSHMPPTGASTLQDPLAFKKFSLTEYRKSVPGRFLMTGSLAKDRFHLFSIDTKGQGTVLKTVESRFREIAITEVRPLEADLYAYVSCVPSKIRCFPAQVAFIGRDGHDVFPRPVPNETENLNFHDFARRKNGNFVFLLATFNFQKESLSNIIEEWDEAGRKVFYWAMDDHASEIAKWGSRSTAHINAIDIALDGNLWISVLQFDAIFKIGVPGGKILTAISTQDWKFENDPYHGFKAQHSVRALPNGNIMLFDNGDGHDGRASRAVEYQIDEKNKIARLVWEYRLPNDEPIFRKIGGSVQRLSNGNTVIAWGVPPTMLVTPNLRVATEVDSQGHLVRELKGNHIGFRTWFTEDL